MLRHVGPEKLKQLIELLEMVRSEEEEADYRGYWTDCGQGVHD